MGDADPKEDEHPKQEPEIHAAPLCQSEVVGDEWGGVEEEKREEYVSAVWEGCGEQNDGQLLYEQEVKVLSGADLIVVGGAHKMKNADQSQKQDDT